MTISAADEDLFILSDEILDHIHRRFPAPNDHNEKINQACATLRALINVIGIVLCEIVCRDCWQLTINAVEIGFNQMLRDLQSVRIEVESEKRARSPSNVIFMFNS